MFGRIGDIRTAFGLPRPGGGPLNRMDSRRRWRGRFVVLSFLLSLPLLSGTYENPGTGSLQKTKDLEGIDVIDKSGTQLPLDIRLKDHDGQNVVLGNYFTKDDARPVILTMGYYECPMLCSLVLNGLVESLNHDKFNFEMGKDFRVLSVSIDPKETVALAKVKRGNYLKSIESRLRENDRDGDWTFHVGEADEVKRLADAVGFSYRYIPKAKQYAHGAAVWVISPEGMISRTHWGISYKPRDLRLSIMDASAGRIGSVLERVLLSCLHYDPDSSTYGLYIFGVMRLGAVLTILAIGGFLALFFYRERTVRRKVGTLA